MPPILLPILSGFCTAGLILLLWPWLNRYALAHPNARSSHYKPTPQGGGAAVVAASLGTGWASLALGGVSAPREFIAVTIAAMLLAIIGALDDIRSLAPLPRLVLQCVAVGLVIAALPTDLRLATALPWWLERAAIFFALLWFINLTNFMDGIDWMTVANAVPMAAAVALAGFLGFLPALPTLFALALLGAMLGFAPFNRPTAKLFLGDVGSLPIGLLLGWLLLQLAIEGYPGAALILPLYPLCDATLTLVRRLAAGEPIWLAHRSHFYQRALDRGLSVQGVIARVFTVNLMLVALALGTMAYPGPTSVLLACAGAALLVVWLLVTLNRART
jgi:UDP-N-acetylmuramyl pentapeptide phosphotransferase/UDP-N-acetylglucosamine-1-phosphate transferase